MGGENVLLVPGLNKPVSDHGVFTGWGHDDTSHEAGRSCGMWGTFHTISVVPYRINIGQYKLKPHSIAGLFLLYYLRLNVL